MVLVFALLGFLFFICPSVLLGFERKGMQEGESGVEWAAVLFIYLVVLCSEQR